MGTALVGTVLFYTPFCLLRNAGGIFGAQKCIQVEKNQRITASPPLPSSPRPFIAFAGMRLLLTSNIKTDPAHLITL